MKLDRVKIEDIALNNSDKIKTKEIIIESGCINALATYLKEYDCNKGVIAVYDDNTYKAVGSLDCVTKEIILDSHNLHANEEGILKITEKLPKKAGVLIAVGGGTIHDLTRYCSFNMGIPFISIPTCASVDGFCSNVAAMTINGSKKTFSLIAPDIILADTNIIKKAPLFLAKSGIGDIIGKYISSIDWKIGNLLSDEPYNENVQKMSYDAINVVEKYGKEIVFGNSDAYEKLMYSLILSGMAMQIMGNSRPASGAEHHIAHVLETSKKGSVLHSDALHGERVCVATLLVVKLYRKLLELDKFQVREVRKSYDISNIFEEKVVKSMLDDNPDNCIENISIDYINSKWERIKEIIESLPTYESLCQLYKDIGLVGFLEDIGANSENVEELFVASTYIRNRLTLLKMYIK